MELNSFARQSTLMEWIEINSFSRQSTWMEFEVNSFARQSTWLDSIHSISWNWIEYLALRVAGQQVPLPLLPLPLSLLLPRDFVISWVMVTPAPRWSPSPSRSCFPDFFSFPRNEIHQLGQEIDWNDAKMTWKWHKKIQSKENDWERRKICKNSPKWHQNDIIMTS